MIIYSVPGLEEEKEWSYEADEWADILLNWDEFCRRMGMPSTTPLRKFIVRYPFSGLSDQSARKVDQLIDLLLQRVLTRCPLETIHHFELDIYLTRGGSVVDNDIHMMRHFCHFLQNLPLNITKFTFLGSSDFASPNLHPHWEATRLIFSSLSQNNQHLTELKTNIFSPILTDSLIPSMPLLQTLTFYSEYRLGNIREISSTLMKSVFNGKNSRLRTFIYSNDSLGTPGASELDVEAMALLKSNTHLEHLTLDHIRFEDAEAIAISDVLTVNKNLRHLCVRYCRLGDRGCMALCEALEVNNTLQSLDLGHTQFLDQRAHSLVAALEINRTLQTLGIRNGYLAGWLLKSDIQLQRIHGISSSAAGMASFIAEGLKVNKSLKSLEFCGGCIGDQGYIALAQALQVNNTLEKLIFDENGIDDARIVALALASALEINLTLQHLSLDNNRLGNAGASLIARALRGNKTLKSLEMNYCYIGNQGCKALALALQVNNTLERLALNENKIGDAGVRAFIPTFRINRTLQHLEIKGGLKGRIPSKKTAKKLLQVTSHFLLPVRVSIDEAEEEVLEGLHMHSTALPPIRLDRAPFFKCDFDKRCRELGDGTISDDHASFRWFLPLLGSQCSFLVKQTVLFLLLRQRADVAAPSLQLFKWKEPTRLQRFKSSKRALLFTNVVAAIFALR